MTRTATRGGIGYRADLDGLRAVAVGLVMLSHAHWPWRNGSADIGVTAFFVLSGYLITSLLAKERERTGSISLGSFYRRRIIRLGPALLGLLAFDLILGLLGLLSGPWQLGFASCLLYVSNWVQAAGVAIHPIGHTWSLAIEEQFYLLWPVILLLAWRRALPIAVLVIVGAAVLRLFTGELVEYFSTFTRIDAILLGCVVAIVKPSWPRWTGVVGVVVLVAVALLLTPEDHDIAIPSAMAATALVIGGGLPALGRLAPIGLRAYSLYLWNTPMTLLFGSVMPLAVLGTIAAAEVSYRVLEVPVLRRGGATRAAAVPAVPAVPSVAQAPAVPEAS
jgi:peptidoglycan/LPS O-acetylase OafA/YrhL